MICTYKHKLALGLVTSPFLADQMLKRVDKRIAEACHRQKLIYTRFVDDITISGPFDLSKSGFSSLVANILHDHGFFANPGKWQFGKVCGGPPITGISIRPHGLSVPTSYIESMNEDITRMRQIASGKITDGSFITQSQLLGKGYFVQWINPRLGKRMISLIRSIDWMNANKNAEKWGLIVAKRKLVRIG
jgi:RNA-directed DNA polymerase